MYLNQKIVVIQHSFRFTGGTIDITVHEVVRGGKLRELTIASGGDWGGTLVDQEFEKFLEKVFGRLYDLNVWVELCKK